MSDKKEFRKKIANLLENALTELKAELGEKKFGKRIEKAAKLLTEGLDGDKPEAPAKKEKAPKVAAEKAPKADTAKAPEAAAEKAPKPEKAPKAEKAAKAKKVAAPKAAKAPKAKKATAKKKAATGK